MSFRQFFSDRTAVFSAEVVSLAALDSARGLSNWKHISKQAVRIESSAITLDEAANIDVVKNYLVVCDGKSNRLIL